METIYERPRDYDLEHEGDDEDIRFYLNLIERLQPRRVLELACGSGRITIPWA
jgi:ubiquinone/menaquinone biosynthesis C-methylase UbiE